MPNRRMSHIRLTVPLQGGGSVDLAIDVDFAKCDERTFNFLLHTLTRVKEFQLHRQKKGITLVQEDAA